MRIELTFGKILQGLLSFASFYGLITGFVILIGG